MANKRVRRVRVIPYAETEYGFRYGDALVERAWSDKSTGAVSIHIHSSRTKAYPLEVYVTRTGKIRVFQKGEWKRLPKKPRGRRNKLINEEKE